MYFLEIKKFFGGEVGDGLCAYCQMEMIFQMKKHSGLDGILYRLDEKNVA